MDEEKIINEEIPTENKLGFLGKIKSFVKKSSEINNYYLKNRPIIYSFLEIIMAISFGIFVFSILFLLPIHFNDVIAGTIILFLLIIYVFSMPHFYSLIIQYTDKHIESFRIYSLICNKLSQIEENFLKNEKINELITLNNYYLKNKPRTYIFLFIIFLIPFLSLFCVPIFLLFKFNAYINLLVLNLVRVNLFMIITIIVVLNALIIAISGILTYFLVGLTFKIVSKYKKE